MSYNSRIRHTLIMAAGRGNRMQPLTNNIPKAMAPYKGDTLIGNNLKELYQNVEFVHVTVGYKSSILAQYLMEKGVDTIINTEGHGNSWWIHHTLLQYLDEPVLVLTCDNITTLNIGFLSDEYHRTGSPACMVVPIKPLPLVEGDYVEHEQEIVTKIQREKTTDIYLSGIQVINPAQVVREANEGDSFYSIWNQLIEKRKVSTSEVYPHPWFSVDTLEQLANAP